MNSTDASNIRERVLSFVKQKGPSLPVQIAKDVGLSILFTSAFLSELFSDKELKMSNMRVGSSPLYFIQGQEPMLEKFAEHLKSKEREAFAILKDKKFLKDVDQLPAIRVALREIKDFAIPFRNGEEIIWRFLTAQEADFKDDKKPVILQVEEVKEIVKEVTEQPKQETKEEPVAHIVKQKKKQQKTEPKIKTAKKKANSSKSKHDEKFIEKVKEFLSKNLIDILHIEGIKKDEITLKVKTSEGEQLLVAYKKKKITESDIIRAAKKAAEMNLKYSVLSMGELPKKFSELIGALQNIKDIRKVE